ncbi:MAG: PD40 domain-containing protein [Chitinophagales bacterium]|nr:PD40 domain-containing protein [Chitinophagales bacterium]
MNTKLRAGFLSALLISTVSLLNAQKSAVNELTSRADRQFDLYSYNLAIQTYEEVLKEDKSNSHALARIGDCHYQLNRPDKAVEWYQKAQNTYNMEPDVPLRLGKALMQTGDYDGAKDQFLLYAETDEKVGRHFANLADFAIKNARKEGQWQAKNEAINTASADFGAAFYQSKVAFSSARTDIQPKGKPAGDIQGGNTNFLFVSQRSPETDMLQKPVFLRSDMQNNRNEGPVSFSSNGRKVAFARNKFISGTRQIAETGMNMSIYLADVNDGVWENVKAFPYNGSTYGVGFPCLSPDGSKLLFASTQPGGFGGWDIYVSNWTSTGWSEPRNLGTPLNTAGNEVTPYFDGNYIYFSSDWHHGLGGLDVFRATLGESEVTEVVHLGTGVNSSRDDYGFIYNATENIGYVTSTRAGGRGNEDLWMVNKKWQDEPAVAEKTISRERPAEYNTPGDPAGNGGGNMHLLITDERGFPLGDVDIDLTDCYGTTGKTGRDGKFYFDELLRPITCEATLRKAGYADKKLELKDFGRSNVKIAMSLDIREEFRGYVYDAQTKAPLRGVSVQVQINDGVLEASTDENGFYSLNIEPGQTYLVSYNKNSYVDAVIRTNFPFNSNHKISSVLMDKEYNDLTVSKKDGYVEYDNTAKPVVYSDGSETNITKVLPKEIAVVQPQEKLTGYSIQLEAMPEAVTDVKLRPYEPLTQYGNLYVKTERNLNKIRLGIYATQKEADAILKKVHQTDKRYKAAWVVEERGADETLLVESQTQVAPAQYNTEEPVAKPDASLVRYAIQLASFPADRKVSITDYTRLNGVGNLYSKTENGYTKVRMGIWKNYSEAESAKKIAMVRGFTDVNIITERADDPEIRDHLIPPVTPNAPKTVKIKEPDPLAPVVYSTTPTAKPAISAGKKGLPYLVRIAALSKPESFEPEPVEDLGIIEKRPAKNSPGMTLILIGSYPDLPSAQRVAQELVERGYKDSYVVKDENGNLVRK